MSRELWAPGGMFICQRCYLQVTDVSLRFGLYLDDEEFRVGSDVKRFIAADQRSAIYSPTPNHPGVVMQ